MKDTDGSTIEEPTPVVDTVDTTIATYASMTEDVIKVASATGIARGVQYVVTDDQWGTAVVEVSSVASTVVTLVEPLPAVPQVGSAFQGLEVTMAVAAISDRALGYRAVVRGPTAGQEEVVRFDVVYQPWSDPIRADDVRRYVSRVYTSSPILEDEERLADVAQRACDHIRSRLRAANRYEHRYFDTSDLYEPCELAMRAELARQGLRPGGVDGTEYLRQIEFDLRDRLDDVIQSSVPYDSDGDDELSDEEAGGIWTGRLFR